VVRGGTQARARHAGGRGRHRGAVIRAAAVSPSLSVAGPSGTFRRSSLSSRTRGLPAPCFFYCFPGGDRFPLYVFAKEGSGELVALLRTRGSLDTGNMFFLRKRHLRARPNASWETGSRRHRRVHAC
jgi:hypothetical protein